MTQWKFLLFLVPALLLAASAAGADAKSDGKLMVLTFDDGPKPDHLFGAGGKLGLYDVLQKHKVPAHFFPIGWKLVARPGVARRLAANGYLYENHTYGHDNLKERRKKFSSDKKFMETVDRARDAVFAETGRLPKYFRPPSWVITPEIRQLIQAAGYVVLELGNPDVNTLDWDDQAKHHPASVLVERVKNQVAQREKSGNYRHALAFHELSLSAEALDELIPYFKSRGYRFGTLDEYFGAGKGE